MADNVLDLDALLRGYLLLKKALPGQTEPTTWKLYDDMPTLVLLPMMHVGILESYPPAAPELPETPESGLTEEIAEAQYQGLLQWHQTAVAERRRQIEQEVLQVFIACFRHSYPEGMPGSLSDAELAATFSHEERYAVARDFFRRRSSLSNASSNGSSSASSAKADRTERTTKGR